MLQMQLDNAVVPLWAAQTLMMRRWKEVCIQPRPWRPGCSSAGGPDGGAVCQLCG